MTECRRVGWAALALLACAACESEPPRWCGSLGGDYRVALTPLEATGATGATCEIEPFVAAYSPPGGEFITISGPLGEVEFDGRRRHCGLIADFVVRNPVQGFPRFSGHIEVEPLDMNLLVGTANATQHNAEGWAFCGGEYRAELRRWPPDVAGAGG